MESLASLAQNAMIWALPVLFAITVHEVAHGWVARALGDPTASLQGRLSLNPARHIDPMGTIVVPLISLLSAGVMYGWARPVPVDARHFKHPRRDMALVAAAGPVSNFAMALGWGVLLRFVQGLPPEQGFNAALMLVARAGMEINLVFMVLNLLPIPPLDGSRVLAGFLTPRAAQGYARLEPYGMAILVVLMLTRLRGLVFDPPLAFAQGFLSTLLGMHGSVIG